MSPTMATDPVNNDVVVAAIKTGIQELKAELLGKLGDERTAIIKDVTENVLPATVEKAVEKFGSAQQAAAFLEFKAEVMRAIKERTARMPGVLAGDGDGEVKSLGQRFAETDQFKAWLAVDRSRDRASLTVKSRILTPMQMKAITVAGSGVKLLPYQAPLVTAVQAKLVVRDLLPVVNITVPSIEYQQMAWTGAADYQVAEGDKKAEADATFTPAQANVRTIAVFVKVSRQMMDDAPAFAAIIDNQLIYMVLVKEDYELLWGNNAAGHLHGIMPQAPAVPAAVLADQTNPADQILAGIAYVASLGYQPNGLVMNPLDWASIQSAKLPNGTYMLGGPPAAFPPNTLWGLSTVTTNAMTATNFLVGDFNVGATLFDREAANSQVAYENEDDFVRNMVTVRAEERIALAVLRPQAFAKSTLAFGTGGGAAATQQPHPATKETRK